MPKIEFDIDDIITLEEKRKILKKFEQDDLLALFKNYKVPYKPVSVKKTPLDQRLALGITVEEKESLMSEIEAIRRDGEKISISSFIRNRSLSDLDIVGWEKIARTGLKELSDEKYDKQKLKKKRKTIQRALDKTDYDDKESESFYKKQIKEIDKHLAELDKIPPRKKFRLAGRVTFDEANHIRWRAARLTLPVADYLRFVIFNHVPFSDADKHMSIVARKRFYISILDILNNGWGTPPKIETCPNCARYAAENKELRVKLERYKKFDK